jgi:hypothetical protein
MKYVGLTNYPDEIKKFNGEPDDWYQRAFDNELEARKWINILIKNYGYKEIDGKSGWQFGFTYTPQAQYKTASNG